MYVKQTRCNMDKQHTNDTQRLHTVRRTAASARYCDPATLLVPHPDIRGAWCPVKQLLVASHGVVALLPNGVKLKLDRMAIVRQTVTHQQRKQRKRKR